MKCDKVRCLACLVACVLICRAFVDDHAALPATCTSKHRLHYTRDHEYAQVHMQTAKCMAAHRFAACAEHCCVAVQKEGCVYTKKECALPKAFCSSENVSTLPSAKVGFVLWCSLQEGPTPPKHVQLQMQSVSRSC